VSERRRRDDHRVHIVALEHIVQAAGDVGDFPLISECAGAVAQDVKDRDDVRRLMLR